MKTQMTGKTARYVNGPHFGMTVEMLSGLLSAKTRECEQLKEKYDKSKKRHRIFRIKQSFILVFLIISLKYLFSVLVFK